MRQAARWEAMGLEWREGGDERAPSRGEPTAVWGCKAADVSGSQVEAPGEVVRAPGEVVRAWVEGDVELVAGFACEMR